MNVACTSRSQPSIPSERANERCSPDAGEGVEQVSGSVAPVVEHLVEGEDIVVDTVVGQVGVLDAAEGDGALCLDQLLRCQNLECAQKNMITKSPKIALNE